MPTDAELEKINSFTPGKGGDTMSKEKIKQQFNEAERDFPISEDELDFAYQHTRDNVSGVDKKKVLNSLLKFQPFLASLCENAYEKSATTANVIPDIILAVAMVYTPDTELMVYDKTLYRRLLPPARALASMYIRNDDEFYGEMDASYEPDLFIFIAKTVSSLNLPEKELKQKLSVLFVWSLMVEEARKEQHPDKYDILSDDEGEEEYDFDKKNLHALQLHVKLLGYRCSADVLVREDCTFEDLHDFLNPLFNREDDHLYRFECEDGCTAVRDEEDIDDDEVFSSECYVGHHLSPGSGAYYLFDYGDEWEHDITVKKVTALDPKVKYPKVLKITGKIPEQYPDCDEEEEDE